MNARRDGGRSNDEKGIARSQPKIWPRRQTADEVDLIAHPRDQSGNGVGVFRFDARQRSGRPHADEAHRVAQRLCERGDRLLRRATNLR
jgi:hypothetical protein